MTCAEARLRLLEVEPHELEAGRGDELADHIAGCAACAADVAHLLAFQRELDDVLGRVPQLDAAEIVRRARTPRGDGRRGADRGPGRVAWRRRETWLSLAAAAALVLVVLWQRPPRAMPGDPWSAPLVDPPTLEAPAGRDVAVLPTSNPDITVIWFF